MVEKKKKKNDFVLITLLVVILGFEVAFYQSIQNHLKSWKVASHKSQLTELYFNNSSKLPTTYIPGLTQYFSFTVHNLENKRNHYVYAVTANSKLNSESAPFSVGEFNLYKNQYMTVPVNVNISDLGSTVRIIVNLYGPNETINFLMNRT